MARLTLSLSRRGRLGHVIAGGRSPVSVGVCRDRRANRIRALDDDDDWPDFLLSLRPTPSPSQFCCLPAQRKQTERYFFLFIKLIHLVKFFPHIFTILNKPYSKLSLLYTLQKLQEQSKKVQ